MHFKQIIAITLSSFVLHVIADRTNQKIYYNIQANHYGMCFRRFNGTHQVGCASERNGNVGVLHYVENQTNVDWLVDRGPHKPYVVLITPQMFNRDVVQKLRDSDKVNGMLVIHTANSTQDFVNDVQSTFSPDKKCPNQYHDLYTDNPTYGNCKNNSWSPEASELLFDDSTNFPVALLLNEADVEFLIETCYTGFNMPGPDLEPQDYPLCSVQLKIAMDGAKDTPTCIRRSNYQTNLNPQEYCDPLGGFNTYSFLEPIKSTDTLADDSIILVAARMDALSMFDNHYPGVESAISGFATIIAVAQAIGMHKQDILQDRKKHIVFAIFNGEAFDYIGSSRMVYDMINGEFPTHSEDGKTTPMPINITHIDSIIEISQVGLPQDGKLWIHTDPLSQSNPTVKSRVQDMVDKLKDKSSDLSFVDTPFVQPLPPASLQSFLKKRDIPSIVISDHDKHFSNRFYNSRFDLRGNLDLNYSSDATETEKYNTVTPVVEQLTVVATAIARMIFEMATGRSDSESVQANNETMANLLYCYTKSPYCELFNYTLEADNFNKFNNKSSPFNLYVGVQQGGSRPVDFRTHTLQNLLANFLGEKVNLNETACKNSDDTDPLYIYTYVNGPVNESDPEGQRTGACIKSTANISLARSPAFDIKDYDWSSNEYSAWTESRWGSGGNAFEIRSFLVPSRKQEVMTLIVGLSIFLVSMVFVFFWKKKSPIIFEMAGSRAPLLQE